MPRPLNPPGRKRLLTGAALLTLALITAAAWLLSVGYCPLAQLGRLRLELLRGTLHITWYDRVWPNTWPSNPIVTRHGRDGLDFFDARWREQVRNNPSVETTRLPAWLIPAALSAAGVPLLRSGLTLRRRAKERLCMNCGYNTTTLPPQSPCPECGKPQ